MTVAALWRKPAPPAVDRRRARIGGYYLREHHQLIKRHVETISLNPDHTAKWKLTIHFELPTAREASCDHDGDEHEFLFPLVFLKKSDPRLGFTVTDQAGDRVTLPTRAECDWISGIATTQAGRQLLDQIDRPLSFSADELEKVLHGIAAEQPFPASLILARLQRNLSPHGKRGDQAGAQGGNESSEGKGPSDLHRIGHIWETHGLMDTLRLMVEHSLAWVPLRGRPGELRSIAVSQDISLLRRSFLYWNFGELELPKCPRVRRIKAKRVREPAPDSVLEFGDKRLGRRSYRISFPALSERIGQPLALMPVAFDFPTVYTRRCSTYHFELVCPSGLSPRALKVATGEPIEEADGNTKPAEQERVKVPEGRTALASRVANHYLPGSRLANDIWFRVTVGVGSGAMPSLWWLAGAITAILLWALAGSNPGFSTNDGENQIAAGILLVVPALVAAMAIGGGSPPATRLIAGARILLLVTGLSAVAAAAVLIGAEPFSIGRQDTWFICAIVATTATMPLATSWILSSDNVWRQLKKLNDAEAQYKVLRGGIGLALLPPIVLLFVGDAPLARGAVGIFLLTIVVGMTALANNRAAIEIGRNRRYVGVALLTAAIACLFLACIELRAAVERDYESTMFYEAIGIGVLFISQWAGIALGCITKGFRPKPDEVHVSPQVGRSLVAKERVLELFVLLGRRAGANLQSAPDGD